MSRQPALKPQDLVLLLKLALQGGQPFTYAAMAKSLFVSASEVHAGLKRCHLARLVALPESGAIQVARDALREFVLFGAKYAFPPYRGSLVRGMPTAYAGPLLQDMIAQPDEPPPVWPFSKGTVRGIALYPLYPTVPLAVQEDPRLHQALSLFDALRIGTAREREMASSLLRTLLAA